MSNLAQIGKEIIREENQRNVAKGKKSTLKSTTGVANINGV